MYDKQSIEIIKAELRKRDETLAVAESVTSGHLQCAFSLADGATQFFQGGITAYNLSQKTRLLKVDPVEAIKCNCVSPAVAVQMALEVLNLCSSHWGIGITGYAAAVPEAGVEKLFCFFAVAHRHEIVLEARIDAASNDLFTVQVQYANEVLKKFSEHLRSNP